MQDGVIKIEYGRLKQELNIRDMFHLFSASVFSPHIPSGTLVKYERLQSANQLSIHCNFLLALCSIKQHIGKQMHSLNFLIQQRIASPTALAVFMGEEDSWETLSSLLQCNYSFGVQSIPLYKALHFLMSALSFQCSESLLTLQ